MLHSESGLKRVLNAAADFLAKYKYCHTKLESAKRESIVIEYGAVDSAWYINGITGVDIRKAYNAAQKYSLFICFETRATFRANKSLNAAMQVKIYRTH